MPKLVTKTKSGRFKIDRCKMASFSEGRLVVVFGRTRHIHHWTELDQLALSTDGTSVTLIDNGRMVGAPGPNELER